MGNVSVTKKIFINQVFYLQITKQTLNIACYIILNEKIHMQPQLLIGGQGSKYLSRYIATSKYCPILFIFLCEYFTHQ